MATYWYERMAASDRPFLVFEGQQTHMHLGGVTIFDGGSLMSPAGGVDIDRVRAYVGSRLHYIPRYRQRLAYVPVENYPVWVDDDRLNLHYHVRHTSLPRPGDENQLKRLTARIMSQRLDRRRPLWEVWIVEGLEGRRFALILKTHHCVVDGVSGVDLMSVLLRPEADDTFEDPPAWIPRPAPTPGQLVRDEIIRRTMAPLALVGHAERFFRALDVNALQQQLTENLTATWDFVTAGLRRPADTPLNRPIGPHRRFDWQALDLSEVKAVKNRLGGTVNDVILTTVAGALHHYLKRKGVAVESVDYKTVVPVSVRSGSEASPTGNRVAGGCCRCRSIRPIRVYAWTR